MQRSASRHGVGEQNLATPDIAERIESDFTYHPPKDGQPERYVAIRDAGKALALVVSGNSPYSREQSLALTKLEEAVFWANAAIARNE